MKQHTHKLYSLMILLFFVFLISGCATFKEQQGTITKTDTSKTPRHTFFIAGGLGNADNNLPNQLLNVFKQQLDQASSASTLLFTGDNVTRKKADWANDKKSLENHFSLSKSFKGETIFIPGNNEWKNYNSSRVERIEDYVKDKKGDKLLFFPENACPLERKVINEDLDIILIDSKWFIANWSRVVDINKKCTDIVTRRRFIEELEGYINDGQGKNILIAMHHPVFSNGEYAGNKTFGEHLKPFPIYGTLKEAILDLGSFDPDHLNSRRYNYLRILVSALAQSSDRVTLVSGHEESLQYLTGAGIHQIISGSLGSKSAIRLSKGRITAIGGGMEYEGKYGYGAKGFAKLEYYADGSSKVTFYAEDGPITEKRIDILPKFKREKVDRRFTTLNNKEETAVVITDPKAFDKSGFYKFLWGKRYRSYFKKPVSAPVAYLDTLYGGLKIIKEGGGHQSFSLRLEDKDGRQYAMRSLRKNALKFLKFKLPGISYNQEDFQDTWAEKVISDFFTTAHPYMQLTIDPLAKAIGVNHSDTELFYIPKQAVLGEYNDTFGDELYFVERRPSYEQLNYKGYRRTIDKKGKITDFESTTDMLEKIKSDESYSVDQRNFIRARIFDMLIGDWDRHQDQWRWIEYEGENEEKEFMPVPRDRDNAFPKFDGLAIKFIKLFVPNTRNWQSFDKEITNVKWQNNSGNKLDRTLLNSYGGDVWKEEAEIIKKQLTDEVIENAFLNLPKEVMDNTADFIKNTLKKRLQNLPQKAVDYSNYLNKIVTITGTEKDDSFLVQRLPDGKTKVVVKRIFSSDKNEIIYERLFNKKITNEIWLYGLGDNDKFKVVGNGAKTIKVRIVGGYGEDEFSVENKKNVKVYEWEHEKTIFDEQQPALQLSDIYKTNSYHFSYFKPNTTIVAPNLGFRTDDGLFLGVTNTFTKNGLNGNSFRQKHRLAANYYFGFDALELRYKGIYGNVLPKWNLEVDGYYTSDRYANNFFGLGNETVNEENTLGRDFYRARMKQFRTSVGLAYYTLRIRALFEAIRVNENEQRLFTPQNLGADVFENQNFIGGEVSGYYDRKNANDFPTKAIFIGFRAGYKQNIRFNDNNFGYASLKLGFDHKLIPSGNLVFSTMAEARTNIGGDAIFFYHAPSIGGDNGLRGFRDQRFTGDSYFYQRSDLKLRLKRYITAVSPVTVGMYGGFDYGRVWFNGESSNQWNTSQGGGLWISSLQALSFNIGYFNSKESNLIQVGFGLSF